MKRVAVLVVLLLACGKRNDLPDEAWAVADYERAGIHIEKPWTADDYTQALAVLERETNGHRERLPRYHGAKSGAVFAKLALDLPDDPAGPIGDRFIAHAVHFDSLNKISRLYFVNTLAVPPREWVELMGTLFREAAELTAETEPFLASFGPDDPKREARLAGLTQMRQGYGQMMSGSVLMAEDKRVPEADRIAILDYVTAVLPVLYPTAPAGDQQSIRERITKLSTSLPAGPLHDAILRAQKALP